MVWRGGGGWGRGVRKGTCGSGGCERVAAEGYDGGWEVDARGVGGGLGVSAERGVSELNSIPYCLRSQVVCTV